MEVNEQEWLLRLVPINNNIYLPCAHVSYLLFWFDIFGQNSQHPVFTVPTDGVYLLVLKMVPVRDLNAIDQSHYSFSATVKVQMKSEHGYLSAADYPLLAVNH